MERGRFGNADGVQVCSRSCWEAYRTAHGLPLAVEHRTVDGAPIQAGLLAFDNGLNLIRVLPFDSASASLNPDHWFAVETLASWEVVNGEADTDKARLDSAPGSLPFSFRADFNASRLVTVHPHSRKTAVQVLEELRKGN